MKMEDILVAIVDFDIDNMTYITTGLLTKFKIEILFSTLLSLLQSLIVLPKCNPVYIVLYNILGIFN